MSEKNCDSVWGVITSPLTYWKTYSNISQRNASAGCGSTPAHWLGHNHTLTYLSGFTVAIKWKYVSCCFMQFEVLVKENRRGNDTPAHECFHLLCHPVPAHCSACKQNLFFCFFTMHGTAGVCIAPMGGIRALCIRSMLHYGYQSKASKYSACKSTL